VSGGFLSCFFYAFRRLLGNCTGEGKGGKEEKRERREKKGGEKEERARRSRALATDLILRHAQ